MKKIFIAGTLTIMSLTALAEGPKKTIRKINNIQDQGYGIAGCGLGSVIVGNKQGTVQIFAATLNGTSGNQTFGISSGTLNCGESGKIFRAEQFIEINKVAIQNDIARGQGESLTALSEVLECTNSNFPQEMKRNYTEVYPQGGATANQISTVANKSCNI